MIVEPFASSKFCLMRVLCEPTLFQASGGKSAPKYCYRMQQLVSTAFPTAPEGEYDTISTREVLAFKMDIKLQVFMVEIRLISLYVPLLLDN